MTLGGFATGLLAESHEGRPTKIEGNPDHPASLGATDAFAQASVLTLYDPDRSQVVTRAGQIDTWQNFLNAMSAELQTQREAQGAGLRVLTETVTSPTLASQLQALLRDFPAARWHPYEPVSNDNARAGALLAFDQDINTVYDFEQADVILSLDGDFLQTGPGHLRYAGQYAARRRVVQPSAPSEMNRLYVVESTPTLTGAMADHRWPMRSSQVEGFARSVAQGLGLAVEMPEGEAASTVPAKSIAALVDDLQEHQGSSLVLAGDAQPPIVHALAHAMNEALGNVGSTVVYTDPVVASPQPLLSLPKDPSSFASLRELTADMQAGRVDVLVILGGNPVYSTPADLNFADALSNIRLRVHLGLYEDETSALCHWHIPEAHYLESWSDARTYDGTVTIIQPLIAPLYGGKTAHELLAVLAGQPNRTSHDSVREYWQNQYLADGPATEGSVGSASLGTPDFETFWRTALHNGVIPGTTLPARTLSLRTDFQAQAAGPASPASSSPDELEVIFRPDPTIWDGRFANNGWLQELPKPLTKLTWDNAALVSPTTAERLALTNEDLVELEYRGRSVTAPIWVMPGHADDSVTVHLGYGRTRAGRVGTDTGFDAYALRTSEAPWFDTGLAIRKIGSASPGTGDRYPLASAQHHHSMEGRNLVRVGTLQQYLEEPDFVEKLGEQPSPDLTLYPKHAYEGYAWGMAIDLNACIGCGACVVACQAENNIPIVGKEQVARSREMHWLRIDRYYAGDLDTPETYFQPVPCMHCENAPCEPVCPVAATTHSQEGLNEMTYNRCIGTRYCSNNCPYKVRRFNFLEYTDYEDAPALQLLQNPDVTVRDRGVMEKCTYCVQRINEVRIQAKDEGRPIRDGEVVTACQQVCPTQAIIFGDINDPNSQVSRLKAQSLNYNLLAELNTRPRTSYLARLRNPNPDIEAE
jgi:molybdopterin-containing oxidoreductase family iron-sulfur binding subunit